MSLPASFINAEHKTQDFYSQTKNFITTKMAGMKVTAFEPVFFLIWTGKPVKLCDLLYCDIHFIVVGWNWACSISEVCLYLHFLFIEFHVLTKDIKGVSQGYILSPWLFNLYAEYSMWNAGLDEATGSVMRLGKVLLSIYSDQVSSTEESSAA